MQSSPDRPDFAEAGAVLTIDLGAIAGNYRTLKAKLGGKPCAGVVKADGYGLGAAQVARILMAEGCDIFFVAHVAEGLDLRDAIGPAPTIYVLNGVPPGAERVAAEAGLAAVLNSAEQARAWERIARQSGRRLPAAIQVDSGMSRIGMQPEAFLMVIGDATLIGAIDIRLVMSHLAGADEPAHPANEAQLAAFAAMRRALPDVPASFANSSGVFLGMPYRFDLGRPGAALYGVNPTPGRPNPMRQVVHLAAKVIQTRYLSEGIGVGYGHAFRTTGPMRAATISLGYADGWPRRAQGAAFLDGVRLPFIGRVSMDSIILDISALEPGRLQAGDLVEVIGPHQTVDDVAALAGTIGYEILTGLGRRFHRRYVGGAGA